MKFSFSWVPEAPKGARWFVRYGPTTKFTRGFRTKAEASRWINELDHLDWRVGYMFRLKGDEYEVCVVSRKGVPA